MKYIGFSLTLIVSVICLCLLSSQTGVEAADDWQERDVLGYSDESTQVLGFTTDSNENIYLVYSINDPSGSIFPFPMAIKYDGATWTELGAGFIDEKVGGQCLVRYDDVSDRLFVGLITIEGLIHIYEFKDNEWKELPSGGRLLRIDPQFIYYDYQVMQDSSLVVAYVDIFEDGFITAKKYVNGEWRPLGEPGFTEGTASYISLAGDDNNQYIYAGVIIDRDQVEVWRYSVESGWEVTDSSSIESGYPYWVKMLMGNGDRPMIIYMDTDFEWKMIGKILDDGIWKDMGTNPFSPGMIRNHSIVMDSDGWPIVFFNDSEHENTMTSMRYDGETWSYIGRRGFTKEGTTILFAGVDKENVPFMLFPDGNDSGHILKMVYSESTAEASGSGDDNTDVAELKEDNDTADNSEVDSSTELKEETTTSQISEATTQSDGEMSDSVTGVRDFNVLLILIALVVIVIIVFFLFKRRKKDEEE